MRKIRHPPEAIRLAVRRGVTHRHQQKNPECDLIILGTAGSREKDIVSGITPALNNSPG